MASSSSTYDVFLSFRSADTRDNFLSHLHQKLVDKNIQTFIDDRLDRGEKIEPSLMKVIEHSLISVIVFSVGYASSPWCLDELVKILDCREKMGSIVMPIFYRVDPSDVEQQTGIFGDGFQKLQPNNDESMDKWRKALIEAATLSGWDWKNFRPDSKLIDKVVKDIVSKISPTSYSISASLVGIDYQIEQIQSLLGAGSYDKPHFVGLWGMGGIGKTTIAEALFGLISHQFDSRCFLRNMREESSKHGLIHVKNMLLSELLGDKDLNIKTLSVLPTYVMHRLKRMKVVVVLDDVNESGQLDGLIWDRSCLGHGSRIIVTSRDKQVLRYCDDIYEVMELQDGGALQLFSMHAFKQNNCPEYYTELAKKVMKYAHGVPLALKLLGSHLRCRSLEEWERVLEKLNLSSLPELQKILEISYDDLEAEVKEIFLDIACFFKGYEKNHVKDILENGCGFRNFDWGIMCLIDKCLLTVRLGDVLEMHDLIQEMGIGVAQREGSRLTDSRKICQMLSNKIGNDVVQGISLRLSENGKFYVHPKAFSRMINLRLLKIYGTPYRSVDDEPVFRSEPGQSENLYLPHALSLLHWEEYPYRSLKSKFPMEHLVELNMSRSSITRLWDGDKCPQNLKNLNLFKCRQLMQLPNLSLATKLETINLDWCESLIKIDSSIKQLHNLTVLSMEWCIKLKCLPEVPTGIKRLLLSGCVTLESLPMLPQGLEEVQAECCTSQAVAALSSYTGYSLFSYYDLNYSNYLKLKENAHSNILADTVFYMEKLAIASKEADKFPVSYEFCKIGTDIPEWYPYKSEGSTLAIEFPPHWFDNAFVGIVFCVVPETDYGITSLYLCYCDSCFKNATGEIYGPFSSFMHPELLIDLDQVMLWYDSNFDFERNNWLIKNGSNVIQAVFKFIFGGSTLKVKKCGIFLIHDKGEQKRWNEERCKDEQEICPKVVERDDAVAAGLVRATCSCFGRALIGAEDYDYCYLDKTQHDSPSQETDEDKHENESNSWDDELQLKPVLDLESKEKYEDEGEITSTEYQKINFD